MLHVFFPGGARYLGTMYLRPRDFYLFEVIQRHGPLPSHYLYEFSKHLAHDLIGFKKRLLALYRAGYLDRPQQLNNPLIHTDFKVYILKDKALEALAGKKDAFATPVGGGYQHALMASCITANIELEVTRAGLGYISQEAIFASSKCPQETKTAKRPLALAASISHELNRGNGISMHRSDRPIEPDQIFGINYGNGFRFFAVEADRGTEPLTRANLNENSILRKVLAYKNILTSGEYKKRWGIPNLFPMFITTADERVRNMVDLTRSIYPDGTQHLLFKAIVGFHVYFRTPPLIPELFGEYVRTGEPFDIRKA